MPGLAAIAAAASPDGRDGVQPPGPAAGRSADRGRDRGPSRTSSGATSSTFSELSEPPALVLPPGHRLPPTRDDRRPRSRARSGAASSRPARSWSRSPPGTSRVASPSTSPRSRRRWRSGAPTATSPRPHLDGYLRVRDGEFRLQPLPGGRTRLEGRTRYEMRIHPAAYWTIWSDALIHAIHARVLGHIKTLAETARSELTCLLDAAGGFKPMDIAARSRHRVRASLRAPPRRARARRGRGQGRHRRRGVHAAQRHALAPLRAPRFAHGVGGMGRPRGLGERAGGHHRDQPPVRAHDVQGHAHHRHQGHRGRPAPPRRAGEGPRGDARRALEDARGPAPRRDRRPAEPGEQDPAVPRAREEVRRAGAAAPRRWSSRTTWTSSTRRTAPRA